MVRGPLTFEGIAASVYARDLIEHNPSKDDAFGLVATLKEASVGILGPKGDATMKLLVSSVEALLNREDLVDADFAGLLDVLEAVRLQATDRDFDRFDDIPPLIRSRPALQCMAVERLVVGLGKAQLWKLRSSSTDELYAHISEADIDTIIALKEQLNDAEFVSKIEALIECIRPRQPSEPSRHFSDSSPVGSDSGPADRTLVEAKIDVLAACADADMLTRLVHKVTGGHLLTSLDDEYWRTLERMYGSEVCGAVRSGLRRLWREHAPLEDATNPQRVFPQTIAGLVAATDELCDVHVAKALMPEEATQALRYSLFELNRFPSYVEFLVECRFAECDVYYSSVVNLWQASSAAAEHAKDVVARLPVALAESGTRCRTSVWAYLKNGACRSHYEVEQALRVLCRRSDDPDLAPYLSATSRRAWDKRHSDFASYFSAWVQVQPGPALEFFAGCAADTSRLPEIVGLADYWSRNRESPLSNIEVNSDELARHLETLYGIIAAAAPPATDPYRTGVFSPNARDNAGKFRSSILGMIESLGGHAAYVASKRLAQRFKAEAATAHALESMAMRIAERTALPQPWTTAQFVAFAKDAMAVPVEDEQALWRRVRRDARSAIQNVLTGRFHVGELLKQGPERDMQLWLARELELLSQQAYSVHRESQLADRTMPDIRAETPRHMVTLELKVADDRTVESLLFDLEWQLKGDYLRDKKSNLGIFIVMHKGFKSWFQHGEKRLSFVEVREVLVARAKTLSNDTIGKKHVEVIAFECPTGHSPRNAAQKPRRKSSHNEGG